MAYPFAPLIKFGVFRRRLQDEFGVSVEEAAVVLFGPRGPLPRIRHFARAHEGKTLRWPLPSLGEDEFLMWDALRSICRALQVPVEPFGLTAG